MESIIRTEFQFPGQVGLYHGKVRDVYSIEPDLLAIIATDRISAFDVIMPWGIPGKGQILNQIAARFLDATSDIVPNWKLATPHPMVTIGRRCQPFAVEMVIRGYLAGHAWREYKEGKRSLCGVPLPEGLKENDPLPEPIITPTTKAMEGHDEDISEADIIRHGLVSEAHYGVLARYTRALFARGSEMARERGLILVDTKYEFGIHEGRIYLIDEVHTPDSSRYFTLGGYEERQRRGEAQRQLSKEFVRQWLMEEGFSGKDGQTPPALTAERSELIAARYQELYEAITGSAYMRVATSTEAIEASIRTWLKEHAASLKSTK